MKAGVVEAIVHDPRAILREAAGRNKQPSAAILDARTLQSSSESGGRAGYDGGQAPDDRLKMARPLLSRW